MHIKLLLLIFAFITTSAVAQDETIGLDLSYQKIERSKDSNQKKYTFRLNDGKLNYIISSRGRRASDPVNGQVELTDEQMKKLREYIKSNFKDDVKKNMSVDSYTAIIVKGSILIGEEKVKLDFSCGSEDRPDEREIVDGLKVLLESFIPNE